MTHPTLADLLASDPAGLAHLATCPSCRRLAELAGIDPPPATAAALPEVDRAVYDEWAPLAEARGGMGRIFRARDRRLDRHVAIKQIGGGSAGARAALRARFEREARLTARLQHPSIIGVHEAGRFADGEPFYAMPLLAGAPLSKEIARRPTLAERIALVSHVAAVAEAIAYAHARGIVHRDIKPDNILIGDFGETVVIDWGLAKELGDRGDAAPAGGDADSDGLTRLGVGTAQYMPPEQGRGDAPDARVDVYAVGATLYHVLAGAPPYGDRDGAVVRRALLDGPPRPLVELVPEVPAELADIVARAMARDRDVRYPTAQALAEELRRYLTGQLLRSRRYSAGELVRHFLRRYRGVVRVVAVALVVLAVGAALAFVRVARERDRARAAQHRAEVELRRARGVVASRLAADPATRFDALTTAITAVAPELAAGRAPTAEAFQGLLDALTAGPMLRPLAHEGVIKGTTFTGDVILGIDEARRLVVWDGRSGELRDRVALGQRAPETIAVSPDGARFAICGFTPGGEVIEWPGGARRAFATATNSVACDFLADGRLVVAADELTVRDPRTLAVLERQPLPAPAGDVALAGDQLAVATLDGALARWRPGAAPVPMAGAGVTSVAMAFGPDGTLYQSGADHVVRVWPPTPGAGPRAVFAEPAMMFGLTLVNPATGDVAVGLWDQTKRRTSVVLAAGGAERRCALAGMVEGWVGRDWLFTESFGPLHLYDVATCRPVLTLAAHRDEVAARIGADGDGARLVTSSVDGSVFLWDLRTGRDTGLLLAHSGEVVALARSPDGTRLVSAGHDGLLAVWRTADGARLAIARTPAELLAAAWLDDARVVTGDADGVVRAVDAATGATAATLTLDGPVSALAVAADRVAIGTLGGALVIADRRLDVVARLASPGPVTAVAWSHDGRWLASAHAGGRTRLWDATGAALGGRDAEAGDDDGDGHAALAFTTGDARLLAARPGGETLVLDPRALAGAAPAVLAGRITAAAIAPDGQTIVTADSDGALLLQRDGAAPRRLRGPGHTILAVAFAPDGRRVAAATVAGEVRVWDLTSGAVVASVVAGDLGAATSLAFADDGHVAVGHETGALRLVAVTPAAALAQACALVRHFAREATVAPYCDSSVTAIERT